MKTRTGGYAHGALQDSVTACFPTLWTGGYAHGALQDSVTARPYPTIWTGGYIHGAPQVSVKARYSTTHNSVTERSYPNRTGGFTHGVLHVCKLACT